LIYQAPLKELQKPQLENQKPSVLETRNPEVITNLTSLENSYQKSLEKMLLSRTYLTKKSSRGTAELKS
jgi:hypothetical protein